MTSILQHIRSLGYDATEVYQNIILVENFLDEEDTKPLWSIINNAKQEDWEEDYRNSQIELARRKYGRTDIDNLILEGVMEYTYGWSDKAIAIPQEYTKNLNSRIAKLFEFNRDLWYGDIDTIQRQYKGSELAAHIDSDGDPDILYAVVCYLNDDYSDGELFFPNIGLEIKPPKNSIIIFPDGEQYKHGVRPPGDGPLRYALPTFVRHISKSNLYPPE